MPTPNCYSTFNQHNIKEKHAENLVFSFFLFFLSFFALLHCFKRSGLHNPRSCKTLFMPFGLLTTPLE